MQLPSLFYITTIIGSLLITSSCIHPTPENISGPLIRSTCSTQDKDSCSTPSPDSLQNHWLYHYIPRYSRDIAWYDIGRWLTWMLFGNEDDGLFGENVPHRTHMTQNMRTAWKWWLRNPLHNFTFYVIGSARLHNSELILLRASAEKIEVGTYNAHAHYVFGSENSSFLCALHGWKPFLSLRIKYSKHHQTDFYLGWRERGNFGLKFTPFHIQKLTDSPQTSPAS